jgi:hypothetical protein
VVFALTQGCTSNNTQKFGVTNEPLCQQHCQKSKLPTTITKQTHTVTKKNNDPPTIEKKTITTTTTPLHPITATVHKQPHLHSILLPTMAIVQTSLGIPWHRPRRKKCKN